MRIFKRKSNNRGFTIVEVVIAMALIAIVTASASVVLTLYNKTYKNSMINLRARTVADNSLSAFQYAGNRDDFNFALTQNEIGFEETEETSGSDNKTYRYEALYPAFKYIKLIPSEKTVSLINNNGVSIYDLVCKTTTEYDSAANFLKNSDKHQANTSEVLSDTYNFTYTTKKQTTASSPVNIGSINVESGGAIKITVGSTSAYYNYAENKLYNSSNSVWYEYDLSYSGGNLTLTRGSRASVTNPKTTYKSSDYATVAMAAKRYVLNSLEDYNSDSLKFITLKANLSYGATGKYYDIQKITITQSDARTTTNASGKIIVDFEQGFIKYEGPLTSTTTFPKQIYYIDGKFYGLSTNDYYETILIGNKWIKLDESDEYSAGEGASGKEGRVIPHYPDGTDANTLKREAQKARDLLESYGCTIGKNELITMANLWDLKPEYQHRMAQILADYSTRKIQLLNQHNDVIAEYTCDNDENFKAVLKELNESNYEELENTYYGGDSTNISVRLVVEYENGTAKTIRVYDGDKELENMVFSDQNLSSLKTKYSINRYAQATPTYTTVPGSQAEYGYEEVSSITSGNSYLLLPNSSAAGYGYSGTYNYSMTRTSEKRNGRRTVVTKNSSDTRTGFALNGDAFSTSTQESANEWYIEKITSGGGSTQPTQTQEVTVTPSSSSPSATKSIAVREVLTVKIKNSSTKNSYTFSIQQTNSKVSSISKTSVYVSKGATTSFTVTGLSAGETTLTIKSSDNKIAKVTVKVDDSAGTQDQYRIFYTTSNYGKTTKNYIQISKNSSNSYYDAKTTTTESSASAFTVAYNSTSKAFTFKATVSSKSYYLNYDSTRGLVIGNTTATNFKLYEWQKIKDAVPEHEVKDTETYNGTYKDSSQVSASYKDLTIFTGSKRETFTSINAFREAQLSRCNQYTKGEKTEYRYDTKRNLASVVVNYADECVEFYDIANEKIFALGNLGDRLSEIEAMIAGSRDTAEELHFTKIKSSFKDTSDQSRIEIDYTTDIISKLVSSIGDKDGDDIRKYYGDYYGRPSWISTRSTYDPQEFINNYTAKEPLATEYKCQISPESTLVILATTEGVAGSPQYCFTFKCGNHTLFKWKFDDKAAYDKAISSGNDVYNEEKIGSRYLYSIDVEHYTIKITVMFSSGSNTASALNYSTFYAEVIDTTNNNPVYTLTYQKG